LNYRSYHRLVYFLLTAIDWFRKDIAVTLIKYGNELDTAL